MSTARAMRVAEAIERSGREAVYRSRVAGAFDAATGERAVSETEYPVRLAGPVLGDGLGESGQLRAGEVRLLLAAEGLAFTPGLADEVDLDGETWRVVRVETVSAAGEACLHVLRATR